MHILGTLSRQLLSLPYVARLGIVVGLFLICAILLAFGFPSPYDGSLFAIPVALAAWLFKGRGALVCISSVMVLIAITYRVRANGLDSSSLLTVLLIGAVALSAEGTVIAYLRYALDLVQAAQEKVQQAQQAHVQTQMAYEYQKKINTIKDDLLTHLGHELRTPLTSMGGYLALLRMQQERLGPGKHTMLLTKVTDSYEELVGMVDTILHALTVTEEFPPPHCEVLSVDQVVHEVIEHMEPTTIQAYTLQVRIAASTQVWADHQFLRQILRNLLSNACKYTPQQTVICIEATQADAASPVCISVQDAGPGIPPAELPQLFEKFIRLQRDRAGKVRGSGLGLFICKQLVEAMNGNIWVESTGVSGEGSRFCFTLPPPSPLLAHMP